MPADTTILASALQTYAITSPGQAQLAKDFLAFLPVGPAAFTRASLDRHFTGSAWLVSADGTRVLLMHHRKLDRWLQPGGHADGVTDLSQVALREAGEESGLDALDAEREIFDLDRHLIQARADEPAHWHYDVRYVVRVTGSERYAANEESLALAWVPVSELAADAGAEESLRRMARKWLART